jgi:proline iminopeptidase
MPRVTANGLDIHYERTGQGPRLLFISGTGGDLRVRPNMLDGPFARNFDLVAYDQRGLGQTEKPDRPYAMADYADDAAGLMDALGWEDALVIGVSFGGMVAQAYATRHPEHPGKLVLYSTSPKVDREENYRVFERLGGAHARAVAEARWKTPNPETQQAYIEVCYPLYNRRARPDPDAPQRSVRHDDVAFFYGGPEGEAVRLDFREALGRIQCPTLVLAGEDDPITPISRSELIAACLPPHLARLVRVPNAGHGIHNDDPVLAMRLLREFILA